jgi:hypothetical protein
MPLQLNDDEMSVLLSLAGPIDQQRRPQFLQEVAQELEASGQAGGPGVVHRVGRVVQRNIGTRRNCQTRAIWRAPKGRILNLENYGRGRDYRSSSVLAFSRKGPALVSYHPTKASMRVAGIAAHNRLGHLV